MKRPTYLSDLSDAQWLAVQGLLPAPVRTGRPRKVDFREIINAIRYLLSTDCRWRDLPGGFPNRSTVRHYYDIWRQTDAWTQMEIAMRNAELAHGFSAKTRPLGE